MEASTHVYALQDARKSLSDIIGKAVFANETSIITRSGKNAAVVISYNDYERFRLLEDQFDGELATQRLAKGGKRYSADEVKAELGL
ncbi:type II toxin-antitoxin system Phd/YefM family antitoxin [Spirosoma arcticum]